MHIQFIWGLLTVFSIFRIHGLHLHLRGHLRHLLRLGLPPHRFCVSVLFVLVLEPGWEPADRILVEPGCTAAGAPKYNHVLAMSHKFFYKMTYLAALLPGNTSGNIFTLLSWFLYCYLLRNLLAALTGYLGARLATTTSVSSSASATAAETASSATTAAISATAASSSTSKGRRTAVTTAYWG